MMHERLSESARNTQKAASLELSWPLLLIRMADLASLEPPPRHSRHGGANERASSRNLTPALETE